MAYSLDMWEVLIRLLKYAIEGIAVGFVAFILPKSQLPFDKILFIALTAAAVFSILDLLAPAISAGTRQGVGLGAGFKLIGLPGAF